MALSLDEARAFHAEFPVIDLHADTPKLMDKLGYDLAARHERPMPKPINWIGHVDVPRLRDGGVAAQFFAFWTWPHYIPTQPRNKTRSVLDQIDALDAAVQKHGDQLVWTRTGADVRAAKRAGKIAVLGGIEGGHALEGRLEAIEMFSRRGVRYLGPLHLWPNALGGTSRKPKRDDGLTALGREVVRECERCGVIVDLAHINRRGFFEVLEETRLPPMVTHTGVTAVHASWRNLDDEHLRAVAQREGCVAMPNLTVALSRRGVSPRVLEKILGGNVLRVLDAVPAYGKLAA